MTRSWLKPPTVKKMKTGDAAWLAGFFDGEGSLTCYMAGRDRKYKTWTLSLPNTHRGSLLKCSRITGVGTICEKTRERSHHKRIWVWQVQSQNNMISVLQQMLPYLEIKKDKAQDFIAQFCPIA